MRIDTENKDGIFVFRISGEININTSPDVKRSFDRVVKEKHDRVIIDLAQVEYVDSSGLATLVEAYKNLKSYGGKLKLAAISSKVRGLFEITKLDKLFDIAEDLDSAAGSF